MTSLLVHLIMSNVFSGDVYYAAILLNIPTIIVSLICTGYEYRYSRNRWYLGANLVSCLVNCVVVAEITLRRLMPISATLITTSDIDVLYLLNLVSSVFLLLLIMKQNTKVLECFSFFNKRKCLIVLKYSKWFLLFTTATTIVICTTVIAFYLHNGGSEDGSVMFVLNFYGANVGIVGVFLTIQTVCQNWWISMRVYDVGRENGGSCRKTFRQLIIILGSCLLLDMYNE